MRAPTVGGISSVVDDHVVGLESRGIQLHFVDTGDAIRRKAGALTWENLALAAVEAQTYPNIVEILVVDGGSTDATRDIARARPNVRVLDNPDRIQAAAMNVGLDACTAELIVRVDGHSELASDYVSESVRALHETGAAMVGGAWLVEGDAPVQRAIAMALMSRFGFGAARFAPSRPAGWRDSVSFGTYRAEVARNVGGYDPTLLVNEDAEFAYRMAPHGGVWFDPSIRFTYIPRETLEGLAHQMFRYGIGRAVTARRHPRMVSARQLAPVGLILGLLSPYRRSVTVAYMGLVLVALASESERDPRVLAAFAVALPVIHVSWGAGFLVGLARFAVDRVRR